MSLLDDARRLVERLPDAPPCCDADDRPNPRGTLIRIVAALEAAERIADPFSMPEKDEGICWYCGEPAGRIDGRHAQDCPWRAIVAAFGIDLP